MKQFSIGAVSRMTQVPTHTLRKWESRHGIAVPVRSETGRRVYTQEHIEQLKLIKLLVDKGHSLAHLANLSTADLADLSGLHDEQPTTTAVDGLVLVGPNVARLLPAHALTPHRHPESFESWLADQDSTGAHAERTALVVEIPSLTPVLAQQLTQVAASFERVIVVYRHAARTTLKQLTQAAMHPLPSPAQDTDILSLVQLPDPAPRPPAALRFSQAELARIANLSPGLQCECPNHIARLLMEISSFEAYSRSCEDSDPAERALHQHLGDISAQARALFEDALIAVASADGLPVNLNH